ncbi:ParB/RepB/Spo0J family partition protein [Actinotalea sp. M2MS4P-6]|uniref:ParB/RepB/Spo0J family partition protein n=1 Tax=Actinotalea sp. M2MS4P-6 TaxID=2983762 RepID=UPI0021E42155|nr:ParB/RepB/Spo0J family partition protein [Actinotalea sp. M2MS4P-6]MCV2395151.1 ParB/RepB/Spo0J family partition protein [Actinotalea sp. M2MS4P-6]
MARRVAGLLPYDAAIEALGSAGTMGRYDDEIPLSAVVGSVARSTDFDDRFRPLRPRSDRWRRVRGMFRDGGFPPPIEVVRLGEVYFVVDGHHRVAAARELGWTTLPAHVRRVCTVAFACACLRAESLPTKAAERRFLERFPLPDDVLTTLDLDRPADWARVADAAMAWGFQQQSAGTAYCCAHDLAAAWWRTEVAPRVARLRADGVGAGLGDLALYVLALAERDGLGLLDWADDPVLHEGACGCEPWPDHDAPAS